MPYPDKARRQDALSKSRPASSGVISPSTVAFTAAAFWESGTVQKIRRLFKICFTDIEIARVGTSSNVGNHPSPNCCLRHASSNSTTR